MAQYNGTYPVGGDIKTIPLTAVADSYYVGMPVAYNDTSDAYEYNASAPEAIVWEEKTLSAEGQLLCVVTGSEVLKSGLVNDSNAALTLTDDAVRAAMLNGIILR